ATTVLQGIAPLRIVSSDDAENDAQRRFRVDSCYAFAAEREVVVRLLPHLLREKPGTVDLTKPLSSLEVSA
ncbi:MAG: hypothetical protein ACREVW_12145, partial [Burkholderiales bacterium]